MINDIGKTGIGLLTFAALKFKPNQIRDPRVPAPDQIIYHSFLHHFKF